MAVKVGDVKIYRLDDHRSVAAIVQDVHGGGNVTLWGPDETGAGHYYENVPRRSPEDAATDGGGHTWWDEA